MATYTPDWGTTAPIEAAKNLAKSTNNTHWKPGTEYTPEKDDINKDLAYKVDRTCMTQYALWNNCNNNCKFCLVKDEGSFKDGTCIEEIESTIRNIKFIGSKGLWQTTYSRGVSILGGELFCFPQFKDKLLELIDAVIEEILLKSPNPRCRFSSVTNGMYDPELVLFPIVDRIIEKTGSPRLIDMNFSWDPIGGYRYKDDSYEELARSTIKKFSIKYDYMVGTQMILTQKVIDYLSNKNVYEWYTEFFDQNEVKSQLSFLYPHPIFRGNHYSGEKNLEGFNFTRPSLIKFLQKIEEDYSSCFRAFLSSTRNSAEYKHIGLLHKGSSDNGHQLPILADGKEIITSCGHSELYRCYIDSDKCMLCDIENIYGKQEQGY